MDATYARVSQHSSRLITQSYSTSFSLATRLLGREVREAIYAIYGMVRLADEIVDTFHGHDQARLLERFRQDTQQAIEDGISLNPVLNNFQAVVNDYGLEAAHIDAFFRSMAMDLAHKTYDAGQYQTYIHGSAEVVGLMCLKVFCRGDPQQYEALQAAARRLGAAFQKINFLRDLREDAQELGRQYFPGVDFCNFSEADKAAVEADIRADFQAAKEGIRQLPLDCRAGVYVAFVYYHSLFRKICNCPPQALQAQRVRIPNANKFALLLSGVLRHKLNLL